MWICARGIFLNLQKMIFFKKFNTLMEKLLIIFLKIFGKQKNTFRDMGLY